MPLVSSGGRQYICLINSRLESFAGQVVCPEYVYLFGAMDGHHNTP